MLVSPCARVKSKHGAECVVAYACAAQAARKVAADACVAKTPGHEAKLTPLVAAMEMTTPGLEPPTLQPAAGTRIT